MKTLFFVFAQLLGRADSTWRGDLHYAWIAGIACVEHVAMDGSTTSKWMRCASPRDAEVAAEEFEVVAFRRWVANAPEETLMRAIRYLEVLSAEARMSKDLRMQADVTANTEAILREMESRNGVLQVRRVI